MNETTTSDGHADNGLADGTTLRISEIFYSLQGETDLSGLPTVFIRLTGCPLRCQYCDTAHAFTGGTRKTVAEILSAIKTYRPQFVTVTGGEPLAQPDCTVLLTGLCDAQYTVSLETSGAISIAAVDPRVIKILDIKTPGSSEAHRNRWDNLDRLTGRDQVKFVICDRQDYDWAKKIIGQYRLPERLRDDEQNRTAGHRILFSPEHRRLPAPQLAAWILEDRLPIRMQIQLHKYIWGDDTRR